MRRLWAGRIAPTSLHRELPQSQLPAGAEGSGRTGAWGMGWLWLGTRGTEDEVKQFSLVGLVCAHRAQGTVVEMTKIQHRRNPLWPTSESPHFHLLKQHFYYKEMLKVKMDEIHFTSPIDFPGYLQLQRY